MSSKNIFQTTLTKHQNLVNSHLNSIINEASKTYDSYDENVKDLFAEACNLVSRGGKRFRASLLIATYEFFGGENKKAILDFAAGLELAHAALLIHDDIIDLDEIRRGEKTVHVVYEEKRAKQYGYKVALLAGDLLSHLAMSVILNCDFEDEIKVPALTYIQNRLFDTGIGQFIDIHYSNEKNLTNVPTETIVKLKTTGYTTLSPIISGAILARTEKTNLEILASYATLIGEAFQMQDDLLGFFGDEKTLGKPVGSDFKEGKLTPLVKVLFSELDKKDMSDFGQANVSREKMVKVTTLAKAKNIDKQMTSSIAQITGEAREIIKKSNFTKNSQDFYVELADYMYQRVL
ncbi:MAG: polyprenyl synthetase family protein [bacterium]